MMLITIVDERGHSDVQVESGSYRDWLRWRVCEKSVNLKLLSIKRHLHHLVLAHNRQSPRALKPLRLFHFSARATWMSSLRFRVGAYGQIVILIMYLPCAVIRGWALVAAPHS